ncbi:unnamed protein product [Effrenium voratum]|uniref:Uncharacterized protein n=1 Tax=Effrenium voratum TaxID=2562239 RepID=A0AA36J0X8_9DINO|nr:unnamed protein product [Effrenium voratum]
MGGSAPLTTKAQADPLSAAAPRVVKAGPLDPATEKWEIAERLRLRSGHNGTRDSPEERPRSSSFDSEDESLAKLSQALSSLERTRTALEKRQLEADGKWPIALQPRFFSGVWYVNEGSLPTDTELVASRIREGIREGS